MDRNGKLVTRHVKPVDDGASKAVGIPAPMVSASPAAELGPMAKIDAVWREKISPEGINGIDGADEFRSSYLERKGVITQQCLLWAIETAKTQEELEATVAILDEAMPAPVAQIAWSDMSFFVRLAEGAQRDIDLNPYERCMNAYDHVVSNHYRSGRSRAHEQTTDYTAHADMVKAAAVARVLNTNNAISTFAQMDEYRATIENHDLLLKHLKTCRLVLNAGRDDPSTYDAIAIAELLEENPGSEEALVSLVADRKRIDMDELREALGTHSSLSQGAI